MGGGSLRSLGNSMVSTPCPRGKPAADAKREECCKDVELFKCCGHIPLIGGSLRSLGNSMVSTPCPRGTAAADAKREECCKDVELFKRCGFFFLEGTTS